jgi:hypothetical protein
MASLAAEYRRLADQPAVSSFSSGSRPQPPSSSARINARLRNIMNSLQRKRADYSVKAVSDRARILEIPADCAGLRLDQALARLLPSIRAAAWPPG